MDIIVYRRNAEDGKVRIFCSAELIEERTNLVLVSMSAYLSNGMGLTCFLKRRLPAGKQGLAEYQFEVVEDHGKPPYICRGTFVQGLREVADDWIQDE